MDSRWLEDLAEGLNARYTGLRDAVTGLPGAASKRYDDLVNLYADVMLYAANTPASQMRDDFASTLKASPKPFDPNVDLVDLETALNTLTPMGVFGTVAKAAKGVNALAAKAEKSADVTRAKRRVGTTGQYVGAPPGVDSPQKFSAIVENYTRNVERGLPGREFYNDSSADILKRVAGDTDLADSLAENIAILSRSNNVAGNTNMSVKGHIQAMTGEPVRTGRFPSRDSPAVASAYRGGAGYAGHKRDPFSDQLAVAWDPKRVGRGVNDMHEAESMGYPAVETVNPKTGKVTRKFVVNTPQQHAFMDEVRARAIDRLNSRAVGGHTDWNTGTAQAANWTGNKINRGEVTLGDAAKDYAYYLPRFEANATFEAVPGIGTGHLQGLLDANYATRDAFTKQMNWQTPYGNDVLYAAQGFLPGSTREGVGRFRNEVNPANVSKPVVAIDALDDGSQAVAGYSRRALDATEGARAYFDVQNAGEWHKVVKAGNADQYTGAALTFPKMDEQTMMEVANLFEPHGYWVATAPEGVTILAHEGTKMGKDFAADVRGILKAAKMNPEVYMGKAETGYVPMFEAGGSGPSPITNNLLNMMDANPSVRDALEKSSVREQVLARNARDVGAEASGMGVARQDVLLAREIFAKDGWAGLREAAKKGIVPVAVLGIVGASIPSSGDPGGA